jgi:hypothetical protein
MALRHCTNRSACRLRLVIRVLVTLCGSLVVVTTGHAQQAGDSVSEAGADEWFRQGRDAFERSDFQTAAEAYRRAWEHSRSYDIAANLGQAELQLGQYRDAAEHLSYALRQLPPSIPAEIRAEMQGLLDEASRHVVTLQVTVEPAGSEVRIDGQVVGRAPLDAQLYLDPGSHQVQASHDGYRAAASKAAGQAGEQQQLGLKLEPVAESARHAAAGLPAESSAPGPGDEGVSGPSLAPVLVGAGLTAAGLAVGVGFEIAAASKRAERDERPAVLDDPTSCGAGTVFASECSAIEELDADARRFGTVAVAGFVTAAVAAAGTLTYLWWPRSDAAQGVALVPAPGCSGVTLRVRGAF